MREGIFVHYKPVYISDLLCDCLELAKCTSLANCVYSQCESGDYGFSVQSTTQRYIQIV